MYHIAVVDDELSTRDFLKRYINNNRSDFVVDMTFTNGNDIIEYIKDNQKCSSHVLSSKKKIKKSHK